MNIKEVRWKNQEFSAVAAEEAHSELERIRVDRGGLKPVDVVEEARDESNPLHPLFPWDDAKAAQIGREAIAARIIRSLRVVVVTPERRTIDTRAFVSMPAAEAKGGRSYDAVAHAMQDEEGRAWVLRQAWLQLKAWRQKYGTLVELAEVCDAIDKVLAKKAG